MISATNLAQMPLFKIYNILYQSKDQPCYSISLALTLTVVIPSLVNELLADLALFKLGVRGESSSPGAHVHKIC